jgi:uncharacterized membrane protein
MNINWRKILSLLGLLLLLINFAQIKEHILRSSPFTALQNLPEVQRYLVIIGIILIAAKIVQELRKPGE